MRTIIMAEERPTLRRCRVINVKEGQSCRHGSMPDQFNLEFYFDNNQYGFGFTQNMTKKEVGEHLVELGLTIIKENK